LMTQRADNVALRRRLDDEEAVREQELDSKVKSRQLIVHYTALGFRKQPEIFSIFLRHRKSQVFSF
jgi:hypothetical protein